MPQMAPISWLILFLFFSITLILFNILNYYCFSYKNVLSSENKNSLNLQSLNWKW
uniref:ATP synthase complex subunit 8 n=1 Tax=Potthastia sp. XL1561 TaxID=2798858 RepID=A0A8A9WMJ5_9DIPT|nr:ATP synthase F0 subunit 8 [Potthastia sp. XL1561]